MGVDIIAQLARKNGANFPLAAAEDIIGAFTTVASTAARDAIPTNILRQGAIVRIGTTANYYEWTGSAWSLVSIGGGGGHAIKDEGVAVTPRGNLNFVGVNVSLSDDGSNTIVTIGQVSLTSGVTGILPVANGGTGLSAGGTNGQILTMVSGAPAWATPGGGSLSAPSNPGDDGKLAIASAGNFTYALAANANIDPAAAIALSKLANGSACSVTGRSANSSGAHADIASSADGEVFRRAGGALGWGTIATAGIADSAVTLAKLANATALSVLGRSANSSGVYADIAFANNDEVLMRSAGVLTTAKIANANIDPAAGIAWSKFATAIGNLSFTGLKALTYNGVYDNATSGAGTKNIDWTNGQLQKIEATGNATLTFTAPAGPCLLQLTITDTAGGHAFTWPTIAGDKPPIGSVAGDVTTVGIYYDGSGYSWNYAFVRDADVATAAGIAGTKIAPDFGSQNVQTTGGFLATSGFVRWGVAAGSGSGVRSAASTGDMRLPRGGWTVYGRNNGDAADVLLVNWDSANSRFVLGDSSGFATAYIYLKSGNIGELRAGTNPSLEWNVNGVKLVGSTTRYTADLGLSSVAFTQEDKTGTSQTGAPMRFQAQACTGTTSVGGSCLSAGGDVSGAGGTGGDHVSRAGDATGASGTRTGGNEYVRGGRGASANGNVLIGWDPIDTPNLQSMKGGVFIKNVDTIPAGNPVGGGYLYVEAGALKFRGSSGTVTTIAPA